MRGSRQSRRGGGGGCNFNFSFKLARVETREDPDTTISGPSSARQRSAIYMAEPVLLGNPILLWFLVGVGGLACNKS